MLTSPEPAELRLQVHPDLAPGLDLSLLSERFDVITKSEPCVIRSRIEEGDDGGKYINFDFKTSDRAKLWGVVEKQFYGDPVLGELLRLSSMTVCTGDDGWEDYLLLYHFNPELELDEIQEP